MKDKNMQIKNVKAKINPKNKTNTEKEKQEKLNNSLIIMFLKQAIFV